MSAYAKLPDLLRRIDALESGAPLCRTRACYAPLGIFSAGGLCGFCESAAALRASVRVAAEERVLLRSAFTPWVTSLSPFIHISAC